MTTNKIEIFNTVTKQTRVVDDRQLNLEHFYIITKVMTPIQDSTWS